MKVTDLNDVPAPIGTEPVLIISGGRFKQARLDRLTKPAIDAAQLAADTATEQAGIAAGAAASIGGAVAQTGADRAAVAVDKVAVHADRLAADSAAATAAGALATAAAIAGIARVRDTYALAFADRGTLATDSYVMALVDETRGGARTIYKKLAGGGLQFAGYSPGAREIYVCSVRSADGTYIGDDSYDGLTPDTPKRTLAAARAIAGNNCTVHQFGGSIFYGERVDWGALRGVKFRKYGQGPDPVWTGRTSLAGQVWTRPDPVNWPKVWTTRVTPPANPDYGFATPIQSGSSSVWQPALYDERSGHMRIEDSGIARYFTGVSRAACIQYVNDNPNTFYVAVVGDASVNPIVPNPTIAGTQIDYWLHLADDADPNGGFITHVDQRSIAVIGPDATIEDLVIECSGNKDHIGVTYALNSTPGVWRRVRLKECAIHGCVATGISFENCSAEAAYHGAPYLYGGGGFHNYRGTGLQARSRGFRIVNCRVKGFAVGFYSHGAGAYPLSTGEHEFADIDGAEVLGCMFPFNYGTENQMRGVKIRRMIAKDADSVGYLNGAGTFANGNVTLEDCRFFMQPNTNQPLFWDYGLGGRVKMINSFVYSSSNQNIFAGDQPYASPADYTTLEMIDSIIIGNFNGAPASRSKYNLILSGSVNRATGLQRGSYLGMLYDPFILGKITANAASVIEMPGTSVDDLREIYGNTIDPGVITGVHRQVFQCTVTAADLTLQAAKGETASYSGAPTSGAAGAVGSTAKITTNYPVPTASIGRTIQVTNPYGTGANYTGRVLDKDINGDGTNTMLVTPAPTGAFAGKAFAFASFNQKLYSTVMSPSVTVSADGSQVRVTAGLGRLFRVGMLVRLGQAPDGQFNLRVLRKITAINGDVFTLDRPINGQNFAAPGAGFNSVDGVTDTSHMPLSTTAMIFIFPFVSARRLATGQVGAVSYSVDFVGGELPSTGPIYEYGGYHKFTPYAAGRVELNPYFYTSAAPALPQTGAPTIDHQNGIIDSGFPLAVGDVLTVTANIEVMEWRLSRNLAASPRRAGDILFRPFHNFEIFGEFARRDLGYQSHNRGF